MRRVEDESAVRGDFRGLQALAAFGARTYGAAADLGVDIASTNSTWRRTLTVDAATFDVLQQVEVPTGEHFEGTAAGKGLAALMVGLGGKVRPQSLKS